MYILHNKQISRSRVELELLINLDMHLFIEREMRGGISIVSKYYIFKGQQQAG